MDGDEAPVDGTEMNERVAIRWRRNYTIVDGGVSARCIKGRIHYVTKRRASQLIKSGVAELFTEHKMAFVFDRLCEHYGRLQVTGAKDLNAAYMDLCASEYATYKDYLNRPRKILDLGCGLGRVAVWLSYALKNPAAEFILADGNQDDPKETPQYGWNASNWYNNLATTERFMCLNGVKNFRLFDLRNEAIESLSGLDLVISMLAVGFHYPIEPYLDALAGASSKNVVMVFGLRQRMTYDLRDYTKRLFKDAEIIQIRAGGYKTKQDRVLILKGLK